MFNFKSSTKSNKVKKSINTILEYAISEKIDEIMSGKDHFKKEYIKKEEKREFPEN